MKLVRLQPVRAPDALDIGEADADRLRHGAPGPLGRLARRFGERQGHDALAHLGSERRDARRTCLVAQQPVDAILSKRSCQRQTAVLLLPVRPLMAFVPSPSAVARTIAARQTCF